MPGRGAAAAAAGADVEAAGCALPLAYVLLSPAAAAEVEGAPAGVPKSSSPPSPAAVTAKLSTSMRPCCSGEACMKLCISRNTPGSTWRKCRSRTGPAAAGQAAGGARRGSEAAEAARSGRQVYTASQPVSASAAFCCTGSTQAMHPLRWCLSAACSSPTFLQRCNIMRSTPRRVAVHPHACVECHVLLDESHTHVHSCLFPSAAALLVVLPAAPSAGPMSTKYFPTHLRDDCGHWPCVITGLNGSPMACQHLQQRLRGSRCHLQLQPHLGTLYRELRLQLRQHLRQR